MNKSIEPNDVFISEESSILQALEQLDQVGLQILFIVQGRKLVACVTDGDIRKAILAGKGLNTPISQVCNYKPVYLHITEQHRAKVLIEEQCLKAIPVVDDNMEIETIIFAVKEQKLSYRGKMDVPVVMMAGGLGTRLFPYTKILPKPLLPIAETPISERIINSFREYGCQDFYMIVNYKKEMIKAYYNEISKDYKLTFVDESKPLGTGGGLKLMEGRVKSTFILTNCDILINDDFSKAYEYHKKKKVKQR